MVGSALSWLWNAITGGLNGRVDRLEEGHKDQDVKIDALAGEVRKMRDELHEDHVKVEGRLSKLEEGVAFLKDGMKILLEKL